MHNYTQKMLHGDQVEALVDAKSVCKLTPLHWDLIETIEGSSPHWADKGLFSLREVLPERFWDQKSSKGHKAVGLIVSCLEKKGWIPLERATPSGKGAPTAFYIVRRDHDSYVPLKERLSRSKNS